MSHGFLGFGSGVIRQGSHVRDCRSRLGNRCCGSGLVGHILEIASQGVGVSGDGSSVMGQESEVADQGWQVMD